MDDIQAPQSQVFHRVADGRRQTGRAGPLDLEPEAPGAYDADNGIPPEQTPDGLDFVGSCDQSQILP
jgi:hypothetical protein